MNDSSVLRREAFAPSAAIDSNGNMTPLMRKQIFAYVSGHDSERCVLRVVCEVAAEPNLAGPQGKTVAEFMTALSQEDASAPWMPYRDAAIAGQESANRSQCLERYPSCTKSTESLVEMARSRISQASEIAAPAA
ncbi:hypothetical protein MRX96_040944 [Rhipicephalus microplus]